VFEDNLLDGCRQQRFAHCLKAKNSMGGSGNGMDGLELSAMWHPVAARGSLAIREMWFLRFSDC
jgi:hypothetical protein